MADAGAEDAKLVIDPAVCLIVHYEAAISLLLPISPPLLLHPSRQLTSFDLIRISPTYWAQKTGESVSKSELKRRQKAAQKAQEKVGGGLVPLSISVPLPTERGGRWRALAGRPYHCFISPTRLALSSLFL